jgi:hypothetical protein
MGEAVDAAGAKDEACTELEWIFAEFVLAVAGGVGTFARNCVIATQQVKQICALQFGCAVCGAFYINQERKRDSSIFPECTGIVKIARSNRREIGAARLDFTLMLAQLRDMLAAEHSAVMAEKNYDGRLRLPQRAEPNATFVGIRENDFGQPCAEACGGHLLGGPSRRSSLPHDMVWAHGLRAGGIT